MRRTRIDKDTQRKSWVANSSDCQRKCAELGENCQGLTIDPFVGSCELFKLVGGVTRFENCHPAKASGIYSAVRAPIDLSVDWQNCLDRERAPMLGYRAAP